MTKKRQRHIERDSHSAATPDDETIREAAVIAAYHSAARASGHVAVDYTRARNVRRQPDGKTGMVFYTDYQTVSVRPDEALVERLSCEQKRK